MKIRPLHDRILVKRSKKRTRPRAGSSSPTRPRRSPRGQVVAVGNGKVARGRQGRARSTSRRATSVLFGKYSGTEIKIDGEEHLILREDDILGVIEK